MDVRWISKVKFRLLHLPYQLHSSSTSCARELFKPSKDLSNLLVCNEKKVLVLGFHFFVSDVMSFEGLNSSLAQSTLELCPRKDTCEPHDFTQTA